MSEPLHGAYGFRLRYPRWGGALEDLVELDTDAPLVTLEWRRACPAATFDHVEDGRAAMGVRGGTAFHVTREPASIVVDVAAEPVPDALVHPIATVPLAILARWRGDVTLHGGAFAAGGAAWVLLGDRHTGKSTTLAVLARRGCPVVADDLVVIRDGHVWSGPRCVDLREDAAQHLQPTRDLGTFGLRRRFRLSSPPAPARLPLGGFFLLDWQEEPGVDLERLPLADRVRVLYKLEYAGLVGAAAPQDVLDLAAAPAWRLTRRSSWSAADAVVDRLLDVAAASRATRSGAG